MVFLEVAAAGTRWDEYHSVPERRREDAKTILIDEWAELPVARLRGILATLDHWKSFADKETVDWRTPDLLSIKLFIRNAESLGPTVPKRRFDDLRSIEGNVGICYHTDSLKLRRAADPPASHTATQARPLKVSLWSILGDGCFAANAFARGVFIFWVFVLLSVCRPVHLQRTEYFTKESRVEGRVFAGKRRIRGRRAPFWWAAPRIGLSGKGVGGQLLEFINFADCGKSSRPFLLPDFLPSGADFSNATAFADKPMTGAKARRMLDRLLRSRGVTTAELDEVDGLYSARRVLPSLAHASSFNTLERLDVGGWLDPTESRRVAMPQLFSEAKLSVQLHLK